MPHRSRRIVRKHHYNWGAFPETVVHGVTGYRCCTLDHYLLAARNIGKINPSVCRNWAEANYSVEKVALMYDKYFRMLNDIRSVGWWTWQEKRAEMKWFLKIYPAVR